MLLLYWSTGCNGPTTDDALSSNDTSTPTSPTGPAFELQVEGGFGSGPHPAGSAVQVWADVDPQTEIVTGWGPDEALLEAPREWNSALVMPSRDASLVVQKEAVPTPIESRTAALPGGTRDLRVVTADAARGVVLFFHGAAYSVDQLSDNAARTVVMHLVRAGFTVVALESEAEAASGSGGWSSSLDEQSNLDLQNARALAELLRQDGTLPDPGAPVVAWGMSSGGVFAHAVGASGIAQIVLASCAPGDAAALSATEAATGWYLAGADTVFPSEPALELQEQLAARGVPTDLYVHPPTPLYDERFTRIAGIDEALSREIAELLRAQGAVDARGEWQVSGSQVELEVPGLSEPQLVAVRAEVEIMAADHELYDDAAARMVAFLLQTLGERHAP
jgi:dienelactone hydrolase